MRVRVQAQNSPVDAASVALRFYGWSEWPLGSFAVKAGRVDVDIELPEFPIGRLRTVGIAANWFDAAGQRLGRWLGELQLVADGNRTMCQLAPSAWQPEPVVSRAAVATNGAASGSATNESIARTASIARGAVAAGRSTAAGRSPAGPQRAVRPVLGEFLWQAPVGATALAAKGA